MWIWDILYTTNDWHTNSSGHIYLPWIFSLYKSGLWKTIWHDSSFWPKNIHCILCFWQEVGISVCLLAWNLKAIHSFVPHIWVMAFCSISLHCLCYLFIAVSHALQNCGTTKQSLPNTASNKSSSVFLKRAVWDTFVT